MIESFFLAVGRVLDLVINIYYLLIITVVAMSWLRIDTRNDFVRLVKVATEPLLGRIRRFLPVSEIDFSPFVALLLLYFAKIFVVGSLLSFARPY